MRINIVWPVVFALVFLASCQSSRFMQDDMYFSSTDAKREVREYDVYKNQKNSTTESLTEDANLKEEVIVKNDNYYDYTYSSRIRRFNTPKNTWAYYDPYYTNYYWYNNSNTNYFGNSVYTTYSWWKSNNNMYYNSYDNNCYVTQPTNFVALMQRNGITTDVVERPSINYTAIWHSTDSINLAKTNKLDSNDIISTINNPVVINNSNTPINASDKSTNSNNNSNTYKRWDNSNADVNISPNTTNSNTNNNWSRSGVFSEGSRNNNYEYKGSAIPDNKKGTTKKKKDTKSLGTNPN